MDALEMLKSDHERVSELFNHLRDLENLEAKREVFETIRDELTLHTRIEETVFYPVFKNRSGFEDMIEESYEDHDEVKEILNELETTEDEVEMDNLLDDLQESVDQHVDFEENELFPKIQELMNEQELVQLGQRLIAAHQTPAQAA